MLGILLRQIDTTYESQHYFIILYKTLFSTMYYGLLRVSEVAGSHPVLVRDVHIGTNKKKFLLLLQTSKMHWTNSKPQMIKISASGQKQKVIQDDTMCLYKLLHNYSKVRGSFKSDTDKFFVHSDGTPITPKQVNSPLNY